MIIDANGTVHFANPAAVRVFGFEIAELMGHDIRMILPSDGTTYGRENLLGKFLATRDFDVIGMGRTVEGKHKDGSAVHMLLSIAANRKGPLGDTFLVRLEELRSSPVSIINTHIFIPCTHMNTLLSICG